MSIFQYLKSHESNTLPHFLFLKKSIFVSNITLQLFNYKITLTIYVLIKKKHSAE